MFYNIMSRLLPTLLILSLTSPLASGKPIPPAPQTVTSPSKLERRFLSGNGGLQAWEVIVIVIGAVIAIMLIGGLGGACEVLLHTRGKIVQSNAEADAKVEKGSSSRAFEQEGEDNEEGGVDSDASTEVEVVDEGSHFSWQPEKMTAGEDMPGGRALSEAETTGDSDTTLNGEQSSVEGGEGSMHARGMNGGVPAAESSDAEFYQEQTRDRVLPWEGHTHPDPALAQFVIGDEECHEHGGEETAGYDHHQGHLVGTVAMPDEADFHPEHTPSSYGHQEEMDTWHETHSGQKEEEPIGYTHERIGQALSAAPVGEYSGQGYSPAAMPDEGDYLAEYRQSQLYLQQEDDWQQYYASSHGASRMEGEHDEHEHVAPRPDPGYF
ncbi:hypothetical protein VM1G_07460 [Cytospora mali]|uniref:Uncharacterized protein n=1 Tax=Cytospora mali TaxID=578113 RepID=A0A194W600_CYTMA|nr:hypothetical protein VM1G_07460 [Valsa mali]